MREKLTVSSEKSGDLAEWNETMHIQVAFIQYLQSKRDKMSSEEAGAFGKWFRNKWESEDPRFRQQCLRIFHGKDEDRKERLMRVFQQELSLLRKKTQEAHRQELLTH